MESINVTLVATRLDNIFWSVKIMFRTPYPKMPRLICKPRECYLTIAMERAHRKLL